MENGGCREITGEQTRGVGKQSRSRVQDGQAEEGDRPHTVEDLQRFEVKSLFWIIWDVLGPFEPSGSFQAEGSHT